MANIQIKPDIKLNIATYKVDIVLNFEAAIAIIKRIEDHLPILRGMRIEGLLLSFEGVKNIDANSLKRIIEHFSIFYVQLRVVVGFCNYSSNLYSALRKLIYQTPIGLYRTIDIMALAIGSSNLHRNSSILIYAQDLAERQLIASTLISNEYFVIMALSKNDFQKKLEDKNRFNCVISHSYFSNIHDDVIINFDEKSFIYKFQGTLDENLKQRINVENFKYRLSIGYTVIVFDFTNIYTLSAKATYFLIELEQISKEFNAIICCIGLVNRKIEVNAISVLEKSSLWLFDSLEEVYEDEEVSELLATITPNYNTGISKKLLELSPQFIRASMEALHIYEIFQIKKKPSKQTSATQIYKLDTHIITHITFTGDFDGEFLFLFSKPMAQLLISNILVDNNQYTQDECLDAMSEFVNSITGKLKSNLRKKNLCIQFSIPYSSTILDDVIHSKLKQIFILSEFSSATSSYHVALSSPIDIDN